jgi:hypothetical protein
MAVPAPNQQIIMTALKAVLAGMLPPKTPIIQGQINRVSEPKFSDFVVMTPLRMRRLATNLDEGEDCAFLASISGTTMTVTAVSLGTILVGATLLGANLTSPAPTIAQQLTGTPIGGIGTYQLSSPQGTVGNQQMASGVQTYMQETEWTVQLDFHSANTADSADMAQMVSTLFRDQYAVDAFAAQPGGVSPFYADDPRQVPFLNDAQQWETRYIVEAVMQANQIITLPQAFAAAAIVGLVNVDEKYPVSVGA